MSDERVRVLLVDDEASLRLPLKRYLENNFGYHVDAAADSRGALELVEENQGQYDVALIDEVLLVDEMLPNEAEADGIQLMQRIKARYPDVETIIFTGWGRESRQRATRTGAFRYLKKPPDYDELAMLIRTAAQQVRLRAISREILSEKEPDQVLENIMVAACSLALADEATIVLLDQTTGHLRVHAKTYLAEQQWQRHFKDQNLSRGIIQKGQVVRVPDTTQDGRVNQKVIDSGIRSFVGVPIPGEEGNLGVLYVYSRKPERFEEWGTVAVLQTLAGQAGLAMVNAQAFQQVHAHAGYMEALVQAGQGFSQTVDLNTQLELAWQFVRERLRVSTFFVALYHKPTDTLSFSLFYDKGKEISLPDKTLGPDPDRWGITGWIVRHGVELQWPTSEDREQECKSLGIKPGLVGDPCQTCLYLPLKAERGIIGVISIQSYDQHAFDDVLLNAFRALGSRLVAALENARLFEETEQRRQLLTTLDEASRHIRADKETSKLQHEIIRQASQLVGYAAGGLFINSPHLKELELSATYKLGPELIGNRVAHAEGLAGLVARTGKLQIVCDYANWPDRETIFEPHGFKTAVGVPLRQAGEVEAVLVVADSTDSYWPSQSDLEILERFAAHAAMALQTSQLMSREQRRLRQLSILHQISDYIQAAEDLDKILHAVLTGVTAGYGLGFNRAALLLLDESHEYLVGRLGIGHFEELEARRDWAQHHQRRLENFRRYLRQSERNGLPLTPVGERIRELRLPITLTACAFFVRAMRKRRCTLVTQDELDKLPESFVKSFEPAFPLVVIPLVARGQAIGLLVADNKFTQSPITSEDEELLLTFLDTAAVAIDNVELMARNRERLKKLEMLSRASNEVMGNLHSLGLEDRLNLILGRAVEILNAEAGSILLVRRSEFLRLEASHGYRDDLPKGREFVIRSGKGTGLTGHIAYTGQLFNAHGEDLRGHWAVAGKESSYVASGECHSLLVTPLKKRGADGEELIGLLRMENKKDKDGQSKGYTGFTEEDEWILSIFAETVVICLENAELFEKTSDWLEEKVVSLKGIQETSAAISAELDLDELLELIAENAAKVFAAPATSLMLWDSAEENLVIRAKQGLTDEYNQQHIPRERVEAVIAQMGRVCPLVTMDLRSSPYGRLDLIEAERLCSALSIPLLVPGRLIGILNIYSREEPRQFTPDEIEVAEVLAAQAAIAIENARLYQSEQQRVKELRGLNRISQTINSLTDIQEVYQQINEAMAQLIGVQMCAVLLYNQAEEALVCQLPMYGVPEKVGLQYRLPVGEDIPAAIWEKQAHFILNDVEHHPLVPELGLKDLAREAGARDTLLVKLIVGNRTIGAVQVTNKLDGTTFSEDDARLLGIFAGQAAAVIENARQYEELRRTKGLIGARTALAWMGMTSSAWRHAIDKHALTIREQTQLLRGDLGKTQMHAKHAQVAERLAMIERLALQILKKPIVPPLSREEGVEVVAVNELIMERANQLWENEPYNAVQLRLDFELSASSIIWGSPEWLRRAFDILVDNAVDAVTGCEVQEIQIGTREVEEGVEIFVADTGPGIPEEIQAKLGLELIEKPEDAKGLGMGLLMAQTIVQTYGGEIRVDSTGPTGTIVVIWLPLEESPHAER